MSTMIRDERRPWLWWVAGGGILIAALVLVGALALPTDGTRTVPGDAQTSRIILDAQGEPLPQAAWKVKVFPAGNGKPSKAQRKAVDAQRPRIQDAVAGIYDALLFEGDVRPLSGKLLTAQVATALAKSKLGLPKGMTEVSSKLRAASVGLDEKATHGAAKVRIVLKGLLDGKTVTMVQNASLWLERRDGRWQAIAFTGEMGRRK